MQAVIAPFTRIILRYGVGLVLGMKVGNMLAGDPDMVAVAAVAVGAAVECVYVMAKKRGWAT